MSFRRSFSAAFVALIALLNFATPAGAAGGVGNPNGSHGCAQVSELFVDSSLSAATFACTVPGPAGVAVWVPLGTGQVVVSPVDFGAVGDGVTDDLPAFKAAEAVIASAGGGTILVPPSSVGYRLGPDTAHFNDNSWVIDTDDLTLECSPGATLLPAGQIGNFMLAVCPDDDATICDATSGATVENVTIKGCNFLDDDPLAHGVIDPTVKFTSPSGSPDPTYGDTITWSGGSGVVAKFDAGRAYIAFEDPITGADPSGALSEAGGWGATAGTFYDGSSGEETHFIHVTRADNVKILNNTFEEGGDECVDISGKTAGDTTNIEITNNLFRNCPGIVSGGSAVAIGGGVEGVKISGNTMEGGTSGGGDGGHTYITVNPNAVAFRAGEVTIADNLMLDTDSDVVEQGILLTGSNTAGGANGPITLSNNTIQADAAIVAGVNDNQAAFRLNASTSGFSSVIVNGGKMDGSVKQVGSADSFQLIGVDIEGDNGDGLSVAGGTISVLGGSIRDFPGRGVYLGGTNGAIEHFSMAGTSILGTSSDATEENIIDIFDTSCPSGAVSVDLSGLTIIADVGGAVDKGILGVTCADQRYTINDVYIDMGDGSTGSVASDHGIMGASSITNSTVRRAGNYGIHVFSSLGGVISGNRIIDPGNRGISIQGSHYRVVNNTVEGGVTAAIDEISGDYNICTGNVSMAIGGGASGLNIECGPSTVAGEGCTAGAGTNSICENNIER